MENQSDVVTTYEEFDKISCFIDKGLRFNSDVSHMNTGIKNGLNEEITKHSQTLDKNALYKKSQKFSKLGKYFVVNFIRFFWKQEKGVKAKILKKIEIPVTYDAYELCTQELQEKYKPIRDKIFEHEHTLKTESKDKNNISNKKNDKAEVTVENMQKFFGVDKMSFDDSENICGLYELCGVLTHAGRTLDSGHYIAWMKNRSALNEWFKFDDEEVSIVGIEDIKKLHGGGDWHMAYMCLYGPKEIYFNTDNSDK